MHPLSTFSVTAVCVVAGMMVVQGCGPCAGKMGEELDTCEADEIAGSSDVCVELGTLGSELEEKSAVSADGIRCYAFDVAEVGVLTFSLSDNTVDVLKLGATYDTDGDRRADDDEPVVTSYDRAAREQVAPLEKGAYVIWIREAVGATKFTLHIRYDEHPTASPDQDPSEQPDEASVDLGDDLDSASSAYLGGYIGPADLFDYYRFSIAEAAIVVVTIEQASSDVLSFGVVADANANMRFDVGEAISEYDRASTISALLEDPGEYFIRVYRDADGVGAATYTLNVSFQEPMM